MARQLSTSLSDLILALSVFYVTSSWLERSHHYAAVGLLIQGMAASAGVVRFSLQRQEGTVILRIHKFLSWLAAVLGLALIGYNFCILYKANVMSYVLTIFALVVLFTSSFQPKETREVTSQAVSGLSLLTVLVLSGTNRNWNGVLASLTYILSGAVIGSEGDLLGLQRVDILHYALVAGNLLFMTAL